MTRSPVDRRGAPLGGPFPPRLALTCFALLAAAGGAARAAPPNDDFADALQISTLSGQVSGTNRGATKEAREPNHAGDPGGRSVWFRWEAPADGGAMFDTLDSSMDTLLAVYEGDTLESLELVAQSDDALWSSGSRVSFEIDGGTVYHIAIDGYEREQGDYVLRWSAVTQPDCEKPAKPTPSEPIDGALDVPTTVTLAWDDAKRLAPGRGRKTIYGEDDRHDLYEESDPRWRAAARAVVALVSREDLTPVDGSAWTLPDESLGEIEELCPEERFRDQPSPAWCSGFLVAPDVVATAGHCIETDADCEDVAFVFDFHMADAATPRLRFDESQIYHPTGLIGHELDDFGPDWALVRLDRPVLDREPLRVRRAGEVADDQSLVMIGHPSGLPLKVAGGARVRDNVFPTYFTTNLDALGGNSGSAVLNADTGGVEGILVRGDEDYWLDGDCYASVECPDDGCLGEEVTRVTLFDRFIQRPAGESSYQLYFGECGDLELVGTTSDRGWTVSGLEPRHSYCWRVVAVNSCGVAPGPVQTFTTADDASPPRFRRGEAVQDGSVNLTDAVAILNYLFLAGAVPGCLDSADTDDNGSVNLTDAIAILNYLFLAGGPPAPPGLECGEDPTEDDLDCATFPNCD